ncbi:MAG: hypothetical protein J6I96_00010 [Oscillospiraceae bacterium]|nr:hypothetical protein [Oscillospiraceae bacterium]
MLADRDLLRVLKGLAIVIFVIGVLQTLIHISDLSTYVETDAVIIKTEVHTMTSTGRSTKQLDGTYPVRYTVRYTVNGEEYEDFAREPKDKDKRSVGSVIKVKYKRTDPSRLLREPWPVPVKAWFTFAAAGVTLLFAMAGKIKDKLTEIIEGMLG